jgi:hypothetical protein
MAVTTGCQKASPEANDVAAIQAATKKKHAYT